MFREYPELKEYKEFNGLSNAEMAFVWHVSNPTSDLVLTIEDLSERRKAAYEKIWGNTNDTRYVDYVSGNIPEKVRAGCERMRNFNPSTRMRAKMMTDQMFSDFETIMKKKMSENDDPVKIKAMAEVKLKIAGELPDLIKRLEGGFGFKDEIKDSDKREPTFMDNILEELER